MFLTFVLKYSWLIGKFQNLSFLQRTRIGLTDEKLKGNFTSSKYHNFLALIYILPLEIILPHLGRI